MNEVWTKWEGLVVNGVLPLRRCLSASDHSAVFLTAYAAFDIPDAAIKLVPAAPGSADAQLAHWRTAIALTHPHLMRLFDAGRCELGGLPYLYVVMELAEQTLAQILPRRALTPEEVRDLLAPTLSALSFLHAKNLVQGRLKPSNFLVVADQLKLASDTVHPGGSAQGIVAERCAYEPPEAGASGYSSAGDIWGLGVTIVEALTQQLPTWKDRSCETVALPATLPAEFAQIVVHCLAADPANRMNLAALERWTNPAAPTPAPIAPRSMPRVPSQSDAVRPEESRERLLGILPRVYAPIVAFAALVIVVISVWALRHASTSPSSIERSAPSAADLQTANSAPQSATRVVDVPPSVLHQEIPVVPPRVRDAVRGHLKVAVRVTVDGSGNVVDETLEKRGPSKYFARLAMDAAKKWQFSPTNNPHPAQWVVHFEFTRSATTGRAEGPKS